METEESIISEMKQLSSSIAAVGNHNVFTVPDDYFNNFSVEIAEKINTAFSKEILTTPFSVPFGFFENFAGNVLAKIKCTENLSDEIFNELETIAPFLNKINKVNVYTVPVNYFQAFTQNNFYNIKPAKIINFNAGRNWVKYAAAAVMITIMALGTLLFINADKKTNQASAKILSNHSSLLKISVNQNISTLSDAELTSYINQSADDDIFSSPVTTDPGAVQNEIKNSSDDEIQQYLKDNKTPGDELIKGI